MLGLLHLVRQTGGQPVMIDAVSRDETIPKSFLAKIFQDLAKAGLLRSQRGAGGGFVLARPAQEITILEVIEAIDGRIALQRCLGEEPECDRREGCALCSLFNQAQDRLKEVFARTSLADLARQQSALGPARPVCAAPDEADLEKHTGTAIAVETGEPPRTPFADSTDAHDVPVPDRPIRDPAPRPATLPTPVPFLSTDATPLALHAPARAQDGL